MVSIPRWKRIQLLLFASDITQKQIAEKSGFSRSYVNMVIHGQRRNLHICQTISGMLNIPFEELFPEEAAERAA